MAKTLKLTYSNTIIGSYQNADVMGQPGETFKISSSKELTPGTGDGQVDRMYRAERSLATGASENLDVSGGLTDIFGEALSLSKIKLIRIEADPTNTTTLSVVREGTNGVPIFKALGDGVDLEPGAAIQIESPKAGFTVTAGTGDLIAVTNGAGATAKYKITVVGLD